MASKKPDLTESFKQDQYTGVLARLSDGQFIGLLDVLASSVKRDEIETVKIILSAIDANPKTKDDEFPKDLSLQMMDFARKGVTDRKTYKKIRAWYSAMEQQGVDFVKAVKKKKAKASAKAKAEAEEKPDVVKDDEVKKSEVKKDAQTTADTPVKDDEGKLTIDDLTKELKMPEPTDLSDLPDPELEDDTDPAPVTPVKAKAEPKPEPEVKEKAKKDLPSETEQEPVAEDKPKPKPKKPKKPKKPIKPATGEPHQPPPSNGLLSVAHQNIQIYNTRHEDNPELFIQFEPDPYGVSFEKNPSCFEISSEGEPDPLYISKRVLVPVWKPRHPMNNPMAGKSLGPIIDFFMDHWVNYDMLLRFVDNMDYTQIVFTARRVWWMVRYNEFLRYSLVKEALVSDEKLHFRLVQRWFTHPLVKYVIDQWELVNKK